MWSKRNRFARGLALGFTTFVVVACDPGERARTAEPLGTSRAALNTNPQLSIFVLFATHSITLGNSVYVYEGDVGVSTLDSSVANQLVVGTNDVLGVYAIDNGWDTPTNILSPSVSLNRTRRSRTSKRIR